jgi:hypothetical protein
MSEGADSTKPSFHKIESYIGRQRFFYASIVLAISIGLLLSLIFAAAIFHTPIGSQISDSIGLPLKWPAYYERVRIDQAYGIWHIRSLLLILFTLAAFFVVKFVFRKPNSALLKAWIAQSGRKPVDYGRVARISIALYLLVDVATPFFLSNQYDPRLWISVGLGQYTSYAFLLALLLFFSQTHWATIDPRE